MKKLVVKKSKPKQEKREADKTEQDYFECVRVFNRPGDVKVSSGISLNDLTLNDHRCRVFTNMILSGKVFAKNRFPLACASSLARKD